MMKPFRPAAGVVQRTARHRPAPLQARPGAHRPARWLPLWLSIGLILAGCSGEDSVIDAAGGSGGSGGDGGDDPSPVADYVGLWDITGSWSGIPSLPNDEATLVVRPLNSDGSADVVILDFADGDQNCSFANNVVGTASESPVDGRVFLDGLFDFQDAVMTLTDNGATLTLQYTDSNDINANGNRQEIVSYQASRLAGLTEADIPVCTFGFQPGTL